MFAVLLGMIISLKLDVEQLKVAVEKSGLMTAKLSEDTQRLNITP